MKINGFMVVEVESNSLKILKDVFILSFLFPRLDYLWHNGNKRRIHFLIVFEMFGNNLMIHEPLLARIS